MKRELKDLSPAIDPADRIIARLIPMKRELKVVTRAQEIPAKIALEIARLIPMKRELKDIKPALMGAAGIIARLIPMKRELKELEPITG